jgi:hypothetical protein
MDRALRSWRTRATKKSRDGLHYQQLSVDTAPLLPYPDTHHPGRRLALRHLLSD